jgi:hypothetical protein
MSHCVTRFTSKPLFQYSGSQHHPPFYVGTQGHECVQDELHFLIVNSGRMDAARESLGSPCTGEGCLIPDSRHIQHSL